jgi:maltoporin
VPATTWALAGGTTGWATRCDFYGEFGLAQTGTVDGVTYKAKVMFNEYNPGTDVGKSSSSFEQMYVEGKGFDISPDTNFWIGKRSYGRADVHILDTFFVRMDGVGVGADSIAVGGGKLGLAYFSSDSGAGFGDGGTGTSTDPGSRLNVDLTDLPVNSGGKLRLTGTYTKGNYDSAISGKGTTGFGLSLQHNQELSGLGGGNTLWLQYAQGSAGLDGNFGTMTAASSVKKWRIVVDQRSITRPTRDALILILPVTRGWSAFGSAISSATLFAGTSGFTRRTWGACTRIEIGSKSRRGSYDTDLKSAFWVVRLEAGDSSSV